MINVKQVYALESETGRFLSEQKVLKFLEVEKQQVLNIIPDPEYFIYQSDYSERNNYYHIVCVYRDTILYQYKLFPQKGTDSIVSQFPFIKSLIYKILCQASANNMVLSVKEEDYLINKLKSAAITDIDVNYIMSMKDSLPEKVKRICEKRLFYQMRIPAR